MALINCPECGNQVSSLAPACPKCGAPMGTVSEKNPVTIQETAKSLKIHVVYSILTVCFGLFILIVSCGGNSSAGVLFSSLVTLGGLVWFLVVKYQIWWQHK